jgi:hypothetical protein
MAYARRWAAAVLSMSFLAGAILVIAAQPADADCGTQSGHFCAYRNSGYGDLLLHKTNAQNNEEVDVADDAVSSGKNGTGYYFRGMDEHTFLPDECVFYWAPHTAVYYVGDSANDKIDHFAVKTSGC